jgi:hypothetical protein
MMIQTNEGLASEDMVIVSEFEKKDTEELLEMKEETGDFLFTVNSIINLQETLSHITYH